MLFSPRFVSWARQSSSIQRPICGLRFPPLTGDDVAEDRPRRRFYDVDPVIQHFEKSRLRERQGFLSSVPRRILNGFDSVQGLFIVLSLGGMISLAFVLVTIGALYGVLPFLATTGGLLLLLSFIVERKVGRSLQFGEYNLYRRMLAQGIAFALFAGLIFFLLFISRSIT